MKKGEKVIVLEQKYKGRTIKEQQSVIAYVKKRANEIVVPVRIGLDIRKKLVPFSPESLKEYVQILTPRSEELQLKMDILRYRQELDLCKESCI